MCDIDDVNSTHAMGHGPCISFACRMLHQLYRSRQHSMYSNCVVLTLYCLHTLDCGLLTLRSAFIRTRIYTRAPYGARRLRAPGGLRGDYVAYWLLCKCSQPGNPLPKAPMDRNGPCKSRWLGYFVDREVGAIW